MTQITITVTDNDGDTHSVSVMDPDDLKVDAAFAQLVSDARVLADAEVERKKAARLAAEGK